MPHSQVMNTLSNHTIQEAFPRSRTEPIKSPVRMFVLLTGTTKLEVSRARRFHAYDDGD